VIKLVITKATGEKSEHLVTPVIEYAFENHAKKGLAKALREDEKLTDIYWLAWECLRRSGEGAKPFGDAFLETLASVDVENADNPNG
jgi:hypothetical protein